MKTINVIELISVVILLIAMITFLILKKRKKISVVILTVLISLGLLGHVGYSYLFEEPKLSLNGDKSIILEANQEYKESGANGTFHNKDISQNILINGEVNTKKPGSYAIKYKYEYAKDKAVEIVRDVYVEDKEKPVIELKGKETVNIYEDEKYKEDGYIAKDNVDGNLTKQVKVKKNEISKNKYELIYSVKDSSGNEASIKRTVNLKEREQIIPASTTPIENISTVDPSSNTGIIYLTFDDGPSSDITPKILDILKEENVQATFFILNYNSTGESLVKREVAEGHTIGIHGYSHVYQDIYKSVDAYMQNITKLQDKIQKSTGVTTYITRFPGGSSNTVSSFNPKIMTKLTKEVVDKGFRYFDWNVSSGDAGGAKNKEKVYKNVVKGLIPNRSNVVLMHDFAGNTKTLNALKDVIQYGKKQGYTFKAITVDTPMVTHGVAN